jgi:hypothetical protein
VLHARVHRGEQQAKLTSAGRLRGRADRNPAVVEHLPVSARDFRRRLQRGQFGKRSSLDRGALCRHRRRLLIRALRGKRRKFAVTPDAYGVSFREHADDLLSTGIRRRRSSGRTRRGAYRRGGAARRSLTGLAGAMRRRGDLRRSRGSRGGGAARVNCARHDDGLRRTTAACAEHKRQRSDHCRRHGPPGCRVSNSQTGGDYSRGLASRQGFDKFAQSVATAPRGPSTPAERVPLRSSSLTSASRHRGRRQLDAPLIRPGDRGRPGVHYTSSD